MDHITYLQEAPLLLADRDRHMTQGSGGVNLGEGGRESRSLRVHGLESLPAGKSPNLLATRW